MSFELATQFFERAAVKIEQNAGKLQKETAKEALYRIVLTTPVKTGKARSNWRVSHGRRTTTVIDTYGAEIAADVAISKGVQKINETPPKTDILLNNRVDYIQDLNQGSSQQAPAGFIEAAVVNALAYIEDHAHELLKDV